jgi:RNA polymerase sigma factor (sigma-70 family)
MGEVPGDEELMQAYQLGSLEAFETLYIRHSGKVYGFIRNRLKDRTAADDVFQATFLKLHTSRTHYDPSFPFAAWLFTVCKSVLIDHGRKKARLLEDFNEEALANARSSEAVVHDLPSFENLPGNQRQVLEFRYGPEDLSFDEIAKRMGSSPGNVRQLVSRAIRKLRGQKS